MKLAAVTYLVRDYDEAINWFVNALDFRVVEDTVLTDTKRWIRIASKNVEFSLLLARAVGSEQEMAIGKAAGGRVAFFLNTNDFEKSFNAMCNRGVRFRDSPRLESYGKVAVFEDLYGNLWDLIEQRR